MVLALCRGDHGLQGARNRAAANLTLVAHCERRELAVSRRQFCARPE